MENSLMLPLGIENFEEMRSKGYYYVDNTGLIRDLLRHRAEATVITRPRRFGKSLTMSMLECFFGVNGDKSIFEGLEISKDRDLCREYMGQYPVVYISLSTVEGDNYQIAFDRLVELIMDVASGFEFLSVSEKLTDSKRRRYNKLLYDGMKEATVCGSLELLCRVLHSHFGRRTILLIDEYDAPLYWASKNGYYDQMFSLMHSVFNDALKDNRDLEFAILTGCLQIPTIVNNLRFLSCTNPTFGKYFGFTSQEVQDLLSYYHIENCYEEVRKWYEGYHFGNTDVSCPWDVINYCCDKRKGSRLPPQSYWIETSGNDEVKSFIKTADGNTRQEIETLVSGEPIEKIVWGDLCYQEIFHSIDKGWSLLYATGYLTQHGWTDSGRLRLSLPNLEVRKAFVSLIWECFEESIRADGETINLFCSALLHGDAAGAEEIFHRYLLKSIAVGDCTAKKERKESFYHGVMLGLILGKGNWSPKSNPESGDGFADVIATPEGGNLGIGIVIEMKYADEGNLDKACQEALDQIEKLHYAEDLQREEIHTIIKYGVGCYKKTCKVVLGD